MWTTCLENLCSSPALGQVGNSNYEQQHGMHRTMMICKLVMGQQSAQKMLIDRFSCTLKRALSGDQDSTPWQTARPSQIRRPSLARLKSRSHVSTWTFVLTCKFVARSCLGSRVHLASWRLKVRLFIANTSKTQTMRMSKWNATILCYEVSRLGTRDFCASGQTHEPWPARGHGANARRKSIFLRMRQASGFAGLVWQAQLSADPAQKKTLWLVACSFASSSVGTPTKYHLRNPWPSAVQ